MKIFRKYYVYNNKYKKEFTNQRDGIKPVQGPFEDP